MSRRSRTGSSPRSDGARGWPAGRATDDETAFELVPVGHRQQGVGPDRSVDRQDPEVGDPAALARRLVDGLADEDPVQPRVETVRIAETPQVAPGDHQRVLQGVLGPIDVAEDALGDREEPAMARPDQVDVRRPITALCRLDEIPIHREGPSVRPTRGRFHS